MELPWSITPSKQVHGVLVVGSCFKESVQRCVLVRKPGSAQCMQITITCGTCASKRGFARSDAWVTQALHPRLSFFPPITLGGKRRL